MNDHCWGRLVWRRIRSLPLETSLEWFASEVNWLTLHRTHQRLKKVAGKYIYHLERIGGSAAKLT